MRAINVAMAGTCNSGPEQVMNNGVEYHNTSSYKLIVEAFAYMAPTTNIVGMTANHSGLNSGTDTVSVDSATSVGGNMYGTVTFIVPPGYYYSVIGNGTAPNFISFKGISWQVCN